MTNARRRVGRRTSVVSRLAGCRTDGDSRLGIPRQALRQGSTADIGLYAALAEQPLDDDAVSPRAVELPVATEDAHFAEATRAMEGAAGLVLWKNAADELEKAHR